MDRSVYEKARMLVEEGRVQVEDETEKAIYFTVEGGSDTYKMRLERNHTFSCTCPFATLQGIPKGAFCSHAVASILYITEPNGAEAGGNGEAGLGEPGENGG